MADRNVRTTDSLLRAVTRLPIPIMKFAAFLIALLPALAFADQTTFPKGTFTLHIQAAYTDDVEGANYAIPSGSVGAGWYVRDSFAIGAEVGVIGFLQGSGDDTPGYNVSAFVRHHFVDKPHYTLYFDALFGPVYADDETPGGGTHFNFLSRFGVGTTVPVDERLQLLAGVRWFHLSNANRHGEDQNPAINGVQYYAGLMWRW